MRSIITSILFLIFVHTLSAQEQPALNIKITHLKGDFYIYETYNYYKGDRISANGMYFLTQQGAVLFDTPWDSTQFQPLLDSIKAKHHQQVVLCIATHFHADRSGGLEYYRQQGIQTYTTAQTDELSIKNGMKRAAFLMTKDSSFKVGQYQFQTFYPGKGHTSDNIVIWFEKEKILYGGCLVKSATDESLGYLGDASIKDYANSIRRVITTCKNPKYIIPGHNDWTNLNSLQHTYNMANKLQQAKKN